jgi:type I restriction-modification system DNA methylase subunit
LANGTVAGIDEAKLWSMADALSNNMDAAEYKHVVLGLIFLKYISDAFEAKHAELETQRDQGADPEDQDEYRAAIENARLRSMSVMAISHQSRRFDYRDGVFLRRRFVGSS